MPIHEITVKEYECGHCGYRWINRLNGKGKPVPLKCAKCKRSNWDDPNQRITPREAGLRRKIKEFTRVYEWEYGYSKKYLQICFPLDLPEKFLRIDPRPTVKELKQVLYPFGYDMYNLRYQYMVPDPDKPGFLKSIYPYKQDPKRPDQMIYDEDNEFRKFRLKQMQKRQELMIEIIKSRGIDYDPEIRLKIQREARIKKHNESYNDPQLQTMIEYANEIHKDEVGDGICEKCNKRRLLLSKDGMIVCKKCGTRLSEKWAYVVMNKRYKPG